MNVYHCEFKGKWPVGANAAVVARNPIQAAEMLEQQLKQEGMEQMINPNRMQLFCRAMPTEKPKVEILLDGDY